jgi:hypothetical protein
VTSDYELLLVITLCKTRFITRISSEPVPYFHVPHRLTTPAPTEIDENNDEEMGMVRQDKGKGREMDEEKERAKKEWLSWYSRDLILPEGGLPDDYMTGVIRVVDGKQYQLDDYENQLEHREFTPLEINIYHAGLVNPNELPAPFRQLDYSRPFGRAILEALKNDIIATTARHQIGQPYGGTALGYVVIRQPHKPTRVYIPEAPYNASTIRTTIINEAHMELGHQGTRKTYLRITDSCYWPGMFKDVEKFVSTCKECQLNKQPTSKPAGVPHILPVPERPWQSIAMDFVGPLTESQGFKNILVIMDRFSGFLLCFPLPESTRQSTQQTLSFIRFTADTDFLRPLSRIETRGSLGSFGRHYRRRWELNS